MPVETKREEIEYSWDGARGAWDENTDTWDTAIYEQYVVTAGEVIASAELRKADIASVQKSAVFIGESILKQAAHSAKEALPVNETVSVWRILETVIQETLNVLEIAKTDCIKSVKESIGADEEFYSEAVFSRVIAENIAANERNSNLAVKNAFEVLLFADDFFKTISRIFCEALALQENCWQVADFKRTIQEGFAVDAAFKRTRNKIFADALQIAERTGKNAAVKEKEKLRLQSRPLRESLLTFKEKALQISESHRKQGNFVMAEQIEVLAQKISELERTPFIESLDISDTAGHAHSAVREFASQITISSQPLNKTAVKSIEDFFKLYDAIIEACQAILSDLRINNGSITLEDFEKIVKTVPGYLPFMDFKVGEYDYKDALVRIAVGSAVAQTEPSIYSAVMHVDIPDTQDRGTAEIEDTEAPTKVFFNKMFYNPPEVSVNLRGGNTGDGLVVPNIVSTDKKDEYGQRYFEVELLNSNMQRVTGLVTWQAVGY